MQRTDFFDFDLEEKLKNPEFATAYEAESKRIREEYNKHSQQTEIQDSKYKIPKVAIL
jgi:hypothetical protein